MIGIKCLRLTLPHVAQPVVMPHQWASPIAMCLALLTRARSLIGFGPTLQIFVRYLRLDPECSIFRTWVRWSTTMMAPLTQRLLPS